PSGCKACEHMFVGEGATILHADVDAFFAAVEQRDCPRLRGRPVIVGAWVVLAGSYEAKAHGVRTATSVARARRLCPGAIVVGPAPPRPLPQPRSPAGASTPPAALGRGSACARPFAELARRDRRRRCRAGRPGHPADAGRGAGRPNSGAPAAL